MSERRTGVGRELVVIKRVEVEAEAEYGCLWADAERPGPVDETYVCGCFQLGWHAELGLGWAIKDNK